MQENFAQGRHFAWQRGYSFPFARNERLNSKSGGTFLESPLPFSQAAVTNQFFVDAKKNPFPYRTFSDM
jgi:hypothetical protein